jgi:CHAD domain-containing protein
MADDKWFINLTPETPADEAARQVLSVRFTTVKERLVPAIEDPENVEHVHQLRVATRRAGAALRTFADCLPEESYRSARKLLRRIRRSAADARDWDVFAASVRESDKLTKDKFAPARAYLLALAAGCRALAQKKLQAEAHGLAADLQYTLTNLAAQARSPAPAVNLTVGDLATKQLTNFFAKFNGEIADRPRSASALHEVRITGKRLRYAIEVFAMCCSPALRGIYYPAVEKAQELLGATNDANVAVHRLKEIRTSLRKIAPSLASVAFPGVNALIADAKLDVKNGTITFQRWCREWALLLAEHPLNNVLRLGVVTSAA